MIRHIATRIIASVFLLSVASLIIAFVAVKINGGELLSVQSGSMVPNINKGDVVVATRVSESQLAVGDVVTFINPANSRQTITHRLVETPSVANQQKYVTKGDANLTADQPIPSSAIIGRSNFSVPYVGFGLDFVKKPIGLILIIYIPALMILISEVRRLSEYYKSSEPYFVNENARLRRLGRSKKNKGAMAIKSVVVALLCTVLVYVPTQAALSTSATLTGTTITTVNTQTVGAGVLFRRVTMRCSYDNTATANKRPEIILYNSTNKNVNIGGWKISDNNGVIVTFPNGKILKKKHALTVTPFLTNGLQYSGDKLKIVNATGQPVDGLSWGTDTSELNPSILASEEGTRLKRKKPKVDTNSASDWKSNDHRCPNRDDDDDDHNDCHERDRTHTNGGYHSEENQSSDDEEVEIENNVNVNTNTNQSSSSGNATSNGNTNGGSATSGNASNSSTTTISITSSNF